MDIDTLELIGLAIALIRIVFFVVNFGKAAEKRSAGHFYNVGHFYTVNETDFDIMKETK